MRRLTLRNAALIRHNDGTTVYPCTIRITDGMIASISYGSEGTTPLSDDDIDCAGRVVLPGFIDPHCHLLPAAKRLSSHNIGPESGVTSITDIQERLSTLAHEKPLGEWIICAGYDEFHLQEKRHPRREDLDPITPYHPVKLTHRSGHAVVLNSAALKRVRIGKSIPDALSGCVEHDNEHPTGLLFEASDALKKYIPSLDFVDIEKGLSTLNERLLSKGVTTVQDASPGNGVDDLRALASLKKRVRFHPKTTMMFGSHVLTDGKSSSFKDFSENGDTVSCIKVILSEASGILSPTQEELDNLVLHAQHRGLQVAIHAFEEAAIISAAASIEKALDTTGRNTLRHRIEHCAVCPPEIASHLAALNIVVVTQPAFIYYYGERYRHTVDKHQLPHLYPLRTLIDAGVCVAGSSDFPLIPADPLLGIATASTRETQDGHPLLAGQSITILRALDLFTVNAAYAIFAEKRRGIISPGKEADLIILNGNPLMAHPDEISDIHVDMTIIDGNIVWRHRNDSTI